MARIVDEREVKQGSKGKPGFYVLVGSLALAAVALAGYLLWTGASSPTDPSRETSRQVVPGQSPTSTSSTAVPPANPAYPAPTETPNPGAAPVNPSQPAPQRP
jgi:flagellar basal body-associated protein FliL